MNAPIYTQFTERMYARLPEAVRESDALNDYALKRYISAIGDVEDQVERLVARFTYLDKQSRLALDNLVDDHSYYGLDYSYFQATDSKRSAQITSNNNEPVFLRSEQAYRIVPNTTIYVGTVFRTDRQELLNTYGLRLWYYDAGMNLISTKDVGRNNGSTGPQWVAVNSADSTPNTAYHVRISPFGQNTSGATATLWVDDVYVRSHYKVTTTNNLVSGGHNFTMRAERDLIRQGDFDDAVEAQYQIDTLRAQAIDILAGGMRPTLTPWGGFETSFTPWENRTPAEWNRYINPALAPAGRTAYIESVVGDSQKGMTWGDNSMDKIPVQAGHLYRLSYEMWTDAPTDNLGVGFFPMWYDANYSIRNNTWGDAHVPATRAAAPPVSTPYEQIPGNAGNRVAADPFVSGQWRTVVQYIMPPENDPEIVGWIPRVHRWNAGSTSYGANGTSKAGEIWRIGDIRIEDVTDGITLRAQADQAERDSLLSEWDRSPDASLVEKALSGVPDIQSYRAWLELGSTTASQPGYARQVITGIEPNSTYTISALMVRDANVPDDAVVRITITPNTGGPVVRTFAMSDFERDVPAILSFAWNSPEAVSTAIVSIEYVTAVMPARGLLINDISVVRFTSDVTQIGRQGAPVTFATTERARAEMFAGRDVRGEGWIRYATQGDPDSDPMPVSEPDDPSGTSFIETGWHQTRPGNTYTFSGEIFSNNNTNYVDLIIWHRNEGKGWGDAMLHRIYASSLNGWVRFERTITVPSGATEFRVNLDVYRASSQRVLNLRNVSLASTSNRSWYMSGARAFGYNALATKAMNFLSRGDLMHYTANLMVTGDPGSGRYGVRVYSNGSQVVHETTINMTQKNQLVPITGSFQVPENQAELRVALFVSDPTPKHQAAYFLSDLEVVHSTQQFVEDPQNLIRNGGFEEEHPLDGWVVLTEREIVRRNLVPNPIGPNATGTNNWRVSPGDTMSIVTDEGRPVLQLIESGASGSLYADPTINWSPPVGTVIRFCAELKVTAATDVLIRVSLPAYNGAKLTVGTGASAPQKPSDGWVYHEIVSTVTEMPSGAYFRAIVYPGASDAGLKFPSGQGIRIRNVLVEFDNTTGSFFDRYTPNTTLAQYSWDSATSSHVESRKEYMVPVNPESYLTTAFGYNKEDVPARPEDVPLGATSDLVDPRTANTEWLPWLAQFAGRNISHFSTMEDARTALASGNNFSAGTIGAIQNAVQTVLTGTKTVRVFPMTATLNAIGQATQWDVSIVTRTSESPDISVMEEAVRLRNAKPAGVVFHFHQHQSTWDAVELANPTWDVWDTRTWTQLEESGLED